MSSEDPNIKERNYSDQGCRSPDTSGDLTRFYEPILEMWVHTLESDMKHPEHFREWYEEDAPEQYKVHGEFEEFLRHAYHGNLVCYHFLEDLEGITKTRKAIEELFGEVDDTLRNEKATQIYKALEMTARQFEQMGALVGRIIDEDR